MKKYVRLNFQKKKSSKIKTKRNENLTEQIKKERKKIENEFNE